MDFLESLLQLALEASPWLVLGLVIGGLIKSLVPTSLLQRHLKGSSFSSIIKASLFGAPLPLCSCGVIPAALGLRRAGASKASTVSFLVSTPETGVDSVSISYALLGPFLAVVRPIAAVISAIVAGLLVGRSDEVIEKSKLAPMKEPSCCADEEVEKSNSCCSSSSLSSNCESEKPHSYWLTAWNDISDTFIDLFDKVFMWLIIGLVFAALVKTYIPVTFLSEWGSGLPAMLVMLVVGIPMYVCATSSTPMAAGLLLAGISPGTAMVYLMVGPASNISTLGVIGKELGKRALIAYLVGVSSVALATGLIVDYLVAASDINIQSQIQHSHEIVPTFIAWSSLALLVAVGLKVIISSPLSKVK